jgi:capsular exopolysaccharide synthesis family protein
MQVVDPRLRQRPGAPAGSDPARATVQLVTSERDQPAEGSILPVAIERDEERAELTMWPSSDLRLVALTDPEGIGAEKFRALVARLGHLREDRELRSVQVTSSVMNEGKTVVSDNLAVTLAKYSGSRTLLVEGDLRRPRLMTRLGLDRLPGLNDWYAARNRDLGEFTYRIKGLPLWILPAGTLCKQPGHILQSSRFANAFAQLILQFDWVIVDSTPMLPVVDANLWSAVVDGTLVVVRENMAPVRALKKGLEALDRPKLVGVVFNETLPLSHYRNEEQYYTGSSPA